MKHFVLYILLLSIAITTGSGCKKEFLSQQPSTAIVVPSTLSDYQQLLNNTQVMPLTPLLADVSADNYYLVDSFWSGLDVEERNAYNWAPDIFQGQGLDGDWDVPYEQVFYANEVLQGLSDIGITTANRQQWESEKGSALFIRAYAFWNLAQVFAPVYDSVTAGTDLGIPLKLSPIVSTPSVRVSVQATYSQIIADLRQADSLLPSTVPFGNLDWPSRPAVLSMLSRVYLSMRSYAAAGQYADSALQLYDSLIDYNTLNTKTILPFSLLNAETIYQSNILESTQCLAAVVFPDCIIDSTLYSSYAPQDLRQALFYRLNVNGQPNLRGSYADVVYPFTGLATDELYLNRAECYARAGNTQAALSDLNTLLRHRWRTGTFTGITAVTAAAALDSVLTERRKELPFRGLRWTDLRRLNKEGRNITLTRRLYGQTYTLPANSDLYTLPVPPDVIGDNPGMIQNPR